MDAPDDSIVLLQKASADLLSELRSALPKFLYRKGVSVNPRCLKRGISPPALAHLIKLVNCAPRWVPFLKVLF